MFYLRIMHLHKANVPKGNLLFLEPIKLYLLANSSVRSVLKTREILDEVPLPPSDAK